jgi:hypothetical protein
VRRKCLVGAGHEMAAPLPGGRRSAAGGEVLRRRRSASTSTGKRGSNGDGEDVQEEGKLTRSTVVRSERAKEVHARRN